MNELQQTQCNILQEFIRSCEKLGLRYYLVCGSALGAVKYGGFIPWDDDIDVAMPRQDYEDFLRLAPRELPSCLFIQNFRTDPAFPQIYTKLRDSRTTFIEKSAAQLPIHHGVGIDIFPLDGYPENKAAGWLMEFRKKAYLQMLGTAFAPPSGKKARLVYCLKRLLGFHRRTVKIAAAYDKMIRGYPLTSHGWWCNHGNWQGKREYAAGEQYAQGADMTFEGLQVKIPKQYDVYLRQKYGDYTQDPPEQDQRGHHYWTVCDCNTPYTEYVKREGCECYETKQR